MTLLCATNVLVFTASLTAANVRHKCKQHRRRLQHRTSTYIAKACHHALCSTILYTATIQSLYSHYTATIQPLYSPRKRCRRRGGLYVGAPAERSGEIDKWEYAERIVRRRSGIDKWEYAERIVQREPDGPMVIFRAPQRLLHRSTAPPSRSQLRPRTPTKRLLRSSDRCYLGLSPVERESSF